MSYRFAPTVRVDLSSLGDGLYAVIRHPKLMPWPALKRLVEQIDGATLRPEAAGSIVSDLVVEWNLEDPVTGEALPLPKDDPGAMERIPGFAVTAIAEVAAPLMVEPAVPKG